MSNEAHDRGLRAAAQKHYDFCRKCEHSPEEDAAEIIKAYLSASGLVMVPRNPSKDMIDAAVDSPVPVSYSEAGWCYDAMISAAPNPFESKQDE